MTPLADFLTWLRCRRARREHAAHLRRRAVLLSQIEERRKKHRAFVPMVGEVKAETTALLRAELVLRQVGR